MRTLWNIIAAMALLNLIALGAGIAWLNSTDRLDKNRLLATQAVFTKTIAEQNAEAKAAEAADAERKKTEAAAAKAALAPLTASEQLAARIETTELDRQRVANLRGQIDALQRALADSQAEVAAQRRQVEHQRAELERARTEAADSVGQDQFQKSLSLITSLKPSEARSMLSEILYGAGPSASNPAAPEKFRPIDAGAAPVPATGDPAPTASPDPVSGDRPTPGKPQVLAYLDAMEERPRTKILQEFMKTSPKLAAELLESLRVRGQIAAVPGKPTQ